MSCEEEDETFEHTLLIVREVSVFKIPPRPTSGDYKCGEWMQSSKIWSGRLCIASCDSRCEIRLEDPNSGYLFAACFVNPGQREIAVEPALDSSRYVKKEVGSDGGDGEGGVDGHIDIHPAVHHRLKTIFRRLSGSPLELGFSGDGFDF